MMNFQNQMPAYMSEAEIAREQASFITKVYAWMSVGLAITGLVAYYMAFSGITMELIANSRILFYILMFAPIGLVWFISARINTLSASTTTALFVAYSAVNGISLSTIFLVFTQGSIASTFFVTAGTFAVMSAYGYFTKTDLTKVGNILIMALIGILIASVVNIFLGSSMLYWIITYVGILIFVGLTAYDTQKIKEMNIIGNEGTEEDKKEALMGALTLYLDFINLFLMLLRLLGDRK